MIEKSSSNKKSRFDFYWYYPSDEELLNDELASMVVHYEDPYTKSFCNGILIGIRAIIGHSTVPVEPQYFNHYQLTIADCSEPHGSIQDLHHFTWFEKMQSIIEHDGLIPGFDKDGQRLSVYASACDYMHPPSTHKGLHPDIGKKPVIIPYHHKGDMQVTIDPKMCLENGIQWWQSESAAWVTLGEFRKVPLRMIKAMYYISEDARGLRQMVMKWNRNDHFKNQGVWGDDEPETHVSSDSAEISSRTQVYSDELTVSSEPRGSAEGESLLYSQEIDCYFRSLFKFGTDPVHGPYIICEPLSDQQFFQDCYMDSRGISTLRALNATEGWYFGALVVNEEPHLHNPQHKANISITTIFPALDWKKYIEIGRQLSVPKQPAGPPPDSSEPHGSTEITRQDDQVNEVICPHCQTSCPAGTTNCFTCLRDLDPSGVRKDSGPSFVVQRKINENGRVETYRVDLVQKQAAIQHSKGKRTDISLMRQDARNKYTCCGLRRWFSREILPRNQI